MSKHLGSFCKTSMKVSYVFKIDKFLKQNGELWSPKFFCSGVYFFIGISPNGITKHDAGWVSLFLYKGPTQSELLVRHILGFKSADGSILVSHPASSLFPPKREAWGYRKFIKRSQLTCADDAFGPNGTLRVFCVVRLTDYPVVEAALQTSSAIEFNKLPKNFKKVYLNGCQTDVVMNVRGRKFSANRSILSVRSSIFISTFQVDMKNDFVNITDCDPESFGSFLLFLYSGRFDVESSKNALGLYAAADKYDVQDLKKVCCDYLEQNLCINSICDVFRLATLHEERELLKSATAYFITKTSEILKTSKWQNFLEENPSLANKLFIKKVDAFNDTMKKISYIILSICIAGFLYAWNSIFYSYFN